MRKQGLQGGFNEAFMSPLHEECTEIEDLDDVINNFRAEHGINKNNPDPYFYTNDGLNGWWSANVGLTHPFRFIVYTRSGKAVQVRY